MPGIPEPAPQPGPGFEERIGTRWVVWIGGLTLALGGFFMVRYSIEAGLLGPGVRTLLGGAFALALLAAGEVTRRKESVSAIADVSRGESQCPGCGGADRMSISSICGMVATPCRSPSLTQR